VKAREASWRKTNAIIYDGETMLTAQVCWQKEGFTF